MFVFMLAKKIKVLFIASWFPSRVKPTASTFVLRHAEAVSLYSDINVLHVCFDNNLKRSKFEIVEEKRGVLNIIFIYIKKPGLFLNKFPLYLKAYKRGYKFISEKYGKPQIIHANVLFPVGLVNLFLRSYRKTPIVFTEHWSGYLHESPLKIGLFKKIFLRKIAERSSFLMPVSENLKNAMQDMGIKGNYQVVPNAVETNIFSAQPKHIRTNKTILHISSLQDETKNISGILNVIKKLSLKRQDFSLHFVSNGNPQPFIDQAEQLSLLNSHVFFHNGKRTEEIAATLQQSDCFILFSNYENLPCVILEAISCGVPVIATNVGDISRYVSDKFGILVKPGDEEGLLPALNEMLDNLEKYDSAVMHEFAEKKFSFHVIGIKFLEIYSVALS